MDIAHLVEVRQQRVYAIRDHIASEEARMEEEQAILDELTRLSSQPTFTISEINFLIEHSE